MTELATLPIEGAPVILSRELNGGEQHIVRFDNGYGASVVRHRNSYGHECGLWELAVLRFVGEGLLDFDLAYDTPITSDVLGHLGTEDVARTLLKIKCL